MPEVARKDKKDTVYSPHGTGNECKSPSTYNTDKGSEDVFAEGIGVVRSGDAMQSHPQPGCTPHAPGLSTYSPNVYANGKQIGRKGDAYDGHKITSGSGKVIAN
jgi:uncharacterized Zn-binding protein involved in type VI secretion